jgi:hypothetical protein
MWARVMGKDGGVGGSSPVNSAADDPYGTPPAPSFSPSSTAQGREEFWSDRQTYVPTGL